MKGLVMKKTAITLIILSFGVLTSINKSTLSKEVSLAQDNSRIIYGTDDRLDYYDVNIQWQKRIIEKSTATIIPKSKIEISGNNVSLTNTDYYTLTGYEGDPLCETERFYGQLKAANSSGTLIDRQLILGALGITSGYEDWYYVVFRFYYKDKDSLQTLTKDDVYTIEETLVNNDGGRIYKLDRPVASHLSPAPLDLSINDENLLNEGTNLTLIGNILGLPTKVAGGAQVISNFLPGSNSFEVNFDIIYFEEVAGIFTDSGKLVGHVTNIMPLADDDFSQEGNCWVSNVVPDSQGEIIADYAYAQFDILCDNGVKSIPICGVSECGDGLCTEGEICEEDCPGSGTIPGDSPIGCGL